MTSPGGENFIIIILVIIVNILNNLKGCHNAGVFVKVLALQRTIAWCVEGESHHHNHYHQTKTKIKIIITTCITNHNPDQNIKTRDGKDYTSLCHMEKESCTKQSNISLVFK